MHTGIDWDFIKKLEGFSKVGYVPYEGNSGVTIGSGFDIGQRDKAGLYSMGFSLPLLTKLLPYCGLKNEKAEKALFAKPLELNDSEANELEKKVQEHYVREIESEYNDNSDFTFCMLDSAKQTVIVSVGFQYGSLKQRCPTFFKLITRGLWKTAVEELRDFHDAYHTRRLKEAALLESSLVNKESKQDETSKYNS